MKIYNKNSEIDSGIASLSAPGDKITHGASGGSSPQHLGGCDSASL